MDSTHLLIDGKNSTGSCPCRRLAECDDSLNSIDLLIRRAMQDEIQRNKNRYVTMETLILRLYRRIADLTRVSPFNENNKADRFSDFHDEILKVYHESIQSKMSHDERAVVERILSKDNPHPNELTKFANCWYKYDPTNACRLFAVDGILSTNPKAYVNCAFSAAVDEHNRAIRALYDYVTDPETIKSIVEKALGIGDMDDPSLEICVELYTSTVGEKMQQIAEDMRSKLENDKRNVKKKSEDMRSKSENDKRKSEDMPKNKRKRKTDSPDL